MIYFYRDTIASANLIPADKFLEIKKEALLFDNVFKLGSTPCMSFTIKVLKGAISSFTNILVVEDGTLMHTLQLDSVDTSNNTTDTYVLNDYMIRFNTTYDASSLIYPDNTSTPVPATYLQILQDICAQNGVTCGVSSFTGSTKTTTQINSTIPARTYISYLAEMNGGYAYISAAGQLMFGRYANSSVATIDAALCSSFKLGALHTIKRVVYDTGDVMYEAGTDDGDVVYIDPSNTFITEQADIDAIYTVVNDFSFWNVEVDKCPLSTATVGQCIRFSLNGSYYRTIVQINQQYGNGWIGGYSCVLDNSVQQETRVVGTEQALRTMMTIIDRNNNTFTRFVSDVNGNFSSMSQTSGAIIARVGNLETASSSYATKDDVASDLESLNQAIEAANENYLAVNTKASRLDNLVYVTTAGLNVGNPNNQIRGVFGSTSLDFVNKSNTILAYVDAEDGLGGPMLSVGSKADTNKWNIKASNDGKHLRFTRHG